MIAAAHVVAMLSTPPFKGGRIVAISSSGQVMGGVHVSAVSSHPYSLEAFRPTRGDVVVLSLEPLDGTGHAAYRFIAGLHLAPVQATSYMPGYFGSPDTSGIWGGNSGGPVVDGHGDVVGIVSDMLRPGSTTTVAGHLWAEPPEAGMLRLKSRNVQEAGASQTPSTTEVPRLDIGLVHPLGDPAVLMALGHAGQGVVQSPDVAAGSFHIWTAGYPSMGQCRASEGRIGLAATPLYIPGHSAASTRLSAEKGGHDTLLEDRQHLENAVVPKGTY
jgi:hypothetical protein